MDFYRCLDSGNFWPEQKLSVRKYLKKDVSLRKAFDIKNFSVKYYFSLQSSIILFLQLDGNTNYY